VVVIDGGLQWASILAEMLLTALRAPFSVQGLTIRTTVTVGVAVWPDDADTPEGLLQLADVAMHAAKRSRRGWGVYERESDRNTPERLTLAQQIADALETGAIEAHFQPVFAADTRRPAGAEALARWRLEDGSLKGPAAFVDAAVEAGLARHLTRRILYAALEQVTAWRAAGARDAWVSVNITPDDLLDDAFVSEVVEALNATGASPDGLIVEVTESSLVADPDAAGVTLGALRRMGVRVALDDFGTGYSSLTHLRELPVDILKMDRSYVSAICTDQAAAVIVRATVALAHGLGLSVVAEGVEDEPTWVEVAALGVARVQGYAGAKPMPPRAAAALFTAAARV
jgi:EAL domain-containing protein (putative c-di-GMP-specific phosphodiesterase class I)